MKIIVLSFVLAMVILATQAFTVRPPSGTWPGRPSFPTFPGQGPFNPRPTFPRTYRFRRSPQDEGEVTGTDLQPLQAYPEPHRQHSAAIVDYNHKTTDGRYGDRIVTDAVVEYPEN